MQGAHSTLSDWLVRIRAEYREMPGLSLSRGQVQRLWGLDPLLCDELLHTLEHTHFLRHLLYVSFAVPPGHRNQ